MRGPKFYFFIFQLESLKARVPNVDMSELSRSRGNVGGTGGSGGHTSLTNLTPPHSSAKEVRALGSVRVAARRECESKRRSDIGRIDCPEILVGLCYGKDGRCKETYFERCIS